MSNQIKKTPGNEGKKKQKWKKLDQADLLQQGDYLLPGRRQCECMTTKHKLINNCLTCGRIVCEQEGEGACFFCGNPVYSPENPLTDQNFVSIDEGKQIESMAKQKAIDHKNKLIGYDRNKIQGSNIVDDQTDWYEVSDNIWLSDQQRDHANQKIEEEKAILEDEDSGVKITFDIDKKQIVEGKFDVYDKNKAIQDAKDFMDDIMKNKRNNPMKSSKKLTQDQENLHDKLSEEIREKYAQQITKKVKEAEQNTAPGKVCRVQHDGIFEDFKAAFQKETAGHDDALQQDMAELFDEQIFSIDKDGGQCLSMHQPWASLVIYGFKRFEGRHWTSRYRGPLWIQAGSRVPTQHEIDMVEAQYKSLYKDAADMPPFPERYPTGSLIGLIDLEDIIRKEDYEKYIDEHEREESTCQYQFVCRNPRRLLYPIRLPGERQIFKIDDQALLASAKKNLIKVRTNWWPFYANKLRGKERMHDEDLELDMMRLEYVKEDMGLVIKNFISADEITRLGSKLIDQIKKNATKMIGYNYLQTMDFKAKNKEGLIHRMKDYLPLVAFKKLNCNRETFAENMTKMDFFIASERDKELKIEAKYRVLIVLGRGIKFGFDYHKSQKVLVKHGSMIVRSDDHRKIVMSIADFEKDVTDAEAKAVVKNVENNSIVIMIY